VDRFLAVAEDDRPVAAEHVDVLVVVGVADAAAFTLDEEDGVLARDEVVGPADAEHAAGDELLRLPKKPLRVLETKSFAHAKTVGERREKVNARLLHAGADHVGDDGVREVIMSPRCTASAQGFGMRALGCFLLVACSSGTAA